MTQRIWEVADFRCVCGKLLMKQAITDGVVELKCPRCNRIVRFSSGIQEDKNTRKTAELIQGKWFVSEK